MKHDPNEVQADPKQFGDPQEISRKRMRKKQSGHRGYRSKLWLVILAILLLVTWLSPWLILNSQLRNSVAQRALGEFEGTIEIGSATTGWLSPIKLENVQLRDRQGELLAEVDQVVSRRALLSLLTHLSSPGEFYISNPTVYVIAEADSLNWERALEPLLSQPRPDKERIGLSLIVENGKVLTRRQGESDWQTLEIPSSSVAMDAESLEVQFKLVNGASLATPAGSQPVDTPTPIDEFAAGTIDFQLSQKASDNSPSPRWQGEFKADRFDLGWASPLLERIETLSSLEGTLNGQVTLEGVVETKELRIGLRQLKVTELDLQIPSLTREDALRLDRVSLDGSLTHEESQIKSDGLSFDSALAQLTANGAIDLRLLQSRDFSFEDLPDLNVEGTIDLERLGDSLPGLVRLREGLTIERGKATLVAVSREEGGERRLFVDLNTDDLQAVHDNRPLAWNRPLHISVSARGTDDRVWLEFFECNADFLNCTGRGDQIEGKLEANADLAKLQEQLGQFIEFGELQLAGTLGGSVSWAPAPREENNESSSDQPRNEDEGRIRIHSSMMAEGLRIRRKNAPEFSEEQINVDATLDVQPLDNWNWKVLVGTARLQTQTESAQAWLVEPMQFGKLLPMNLEIEVEGELANIIQRARPWMSEASLDAQGGLSIHGPILIEEGSVRLNHLKVGIKRLRLSGEGFALREPEVQVELVGDVNIANQRMDLSTSSLTSTTIAFSLNRFEQEWSDDSPHTAIELVYRADPSKVMSGVDALEEIAYRPFGEFTGNIVLTNQNDGINLNVTGESIPFTLYRKMISPENLPADGAAYESVWTEEEVSFAAEIEHRSDKERFNIKNLQVVSPSLSVHAEGYVARLDQDAFVDLTGEITTDLDRISDRTEFLARQNIQIRGKSTEPFSVRGRLRDIGEDGQESYENRGLVPRSLTASLATSFDSTNLAGLETGGARIAANLQGQVIRMEPIDLPVGQGKLAASPLIRMSGPIPVIELRNEKLLQNIALTPEVTRSWIGYTAPIIASSTKAEGTFSVDIDRAAIPLTDAVTGSASGRLLISEASLGPGPLGVQMLLLARQVRLAVTGRAGTRDVEEMGARLPKQTIQFQLQDRRVYHDRVVVQIDDLQLTTSGSIGADQSLDMIVEVRIPESWVAGRPIAAAIASADLKLPLRGSLSSPEIDARQLLRQLGGSLLENELRRGLRDIFGGRNN